MKSFASVFLVSALLLGPIGIARAEDAPPLQRDNSGVNVRDRDDAAVTAGQQSNAKGDVELTRQIREAVVKDSSLSVMAQNVKIVSANGSVTLRGPVKTEAEKDAIGSKAQAIAGADRVSNRLEVKNQ
jgi:hyperosmotically inducible periplasmic protein